MDTASFSRGGIFLGRRWIRRFVFSISKKVRIVMHRKIMLVWIVGGIFLAACGSGKYGDAEEMMSKQAKITEDYVNGLEAAKNADDVVDVINEFSEGMKSLIPKIKEYKEKFPELWAGDGEIPKEIKAQQKRLEEAGRKVQGATMNMMKYMMDPKVQEAMRKMGQEMSRMQ
jgi:hypothetical protein